jgi:hypothetical protein
MKEPLKEQIHRARVECRMNRRFLKYHGTRNMGPVIARAVVFPSGAGGFSMSRDV